MLVCADSTLLSTEGRDSPLLVAGVGFGGSLELVWQLLWQSKATSALKLGRLKLASL